LGEARRRQAAAKLHLRLNLQTFLPGFAVIEEASHHDSRRMGALCAGVQAGEIVIFDKAYVHFEHLFELAQRGVFWITRAKDNMAVKVLQSNRNKAEGIIADEQIKQTLKLSDFLGYSKHAIRWQIWAALLLYVLLRFQGWAAQWAHSFTRLFALVRGLLWERFNLSDLLRDYGTASEPWRMCAQPEQTYFPGFAR